MDVIEGRFWAKVRSAEDPNVCWEWVGGKSKQGYGYIQDGHAWRAHRWSYTKWVGEIPDGMQLDHLCRNRACVNPAHLEPVTARENVLRGEGICAVNAKKELCKRGHQLRRRLTRPGWRECPTCKTAKTMEARRRAAGGLA